MLCDFVLWMTSCIYIMRHIQVSSHISEGIWLWRQAVCNEVARAKSDIIDCLGRSLLFQTSLPWDEQLRSDQLSEIASSMAYMHLSAAVAAEKQFHCQTIPYQRLFSPSAFADFISCFGVIASKRKQFQLVTCQIVFG